MLRKLAPLKFHWIALWCLWALAAPASTFVGNGGTPGDLEFAVAKSQLVSVLKSLKNPSNLRDFTVCPEEYQRFPRCKSLGELTEAQSDYVRKFGAEQGPRILALFETGGITQRWTDEQIAVKDGDGLRSVDAVMDPKTRTITINKTRFLEMIASERVFLLAHEMGHLVDLEGRKIDDDQPVGPFKDADGGRGMLNAFGAASAQAAAEGGAITQYQSKLDTSQSWKNSWLTLRTQTTSGGSATSSQLANSSLTGLGVSYRYQFTPHWGVVGEAQSAVKDRTVLGTISANESRSTVGVGLAYRIFFTEDAMSGWAHHHLLVEGLFKRVTGTYKISEGINALEDEASANTWGANLKYFLPLRSNFWIDLAIGAEGPSYKYTKINVNSLNSSAVTEAGVSYAF